MPVHCRVAALIAVPLIAAAAADGAATFAHDVQPVIAKYCADCHGGDTTKGDVDLARFADESDASRSTRVWRQVAIKVAGREMPPATKPQPTDGERAALVRWIVDARARQPKDPGRVTIHRLNRAEYDATIRDLCAVDLEPAKDFPADDVGQGFDNIADVLALPPLLFEKYLAAADAVLAKAIVDQRIEVHVDAAAMSAVKAGQPVAATPAGERTFDDVGEAWQVVKVPSAGKHTLKVKAWAVNGGAEPAAMVLKVDERPVKTFKVLNGEKNAGTFSAVVDLTPGDRRIAIAFVNPISGDALPPEPEQPKRRAGQGANAGAKKPPANAPPAKPAAKPADDKPQVRALSLDWLEVQGPPSATPPESHKRIMVAKPSDKLAKRDAARQIVERFATRAFRRPVDDHDVERLLTIFDKSDAAGEPFEAAIRRTLSAVLVSPRFLFRIERDKPASDGIARLDGWEVASRLSYFLWSSMPDDELFDAAKAGALAEPEAIAKQVKRMLASPKSRALVDGFAGQWLPLRKIETISPDPKLFPEFDAALRKAMIDEAEAFFAGVIKDDRPILDFVDCDYAWVNDRLAKLYGLPPVAGAQVRKVALTDHARGGVLGMAGILAATSNPNRTSPVKRGKFILDELIGDPVPPPPPGVGDLPDPDAAAAKPATLRQQLEAHRTRADCMGCHRRLDPLGLGLEGFDAIGRARADADAHGGLPGGTSFDGVAGLKQALLGVHRDDVVRCFAERLLVYALGRGLEDADATAIDGVVAAAAREDDRFSAVVAAICRSYPFLYRRNAHD